MKTRIDLFSSEPVIIAVLLPAPGYPVRYVSNNFNQLLGYTPEEWKSDKFIYLNIIHTDDIDRIKKEVNINVFNLLQ